jgi:uncharacterized protein (DUF1778 family)
MRRVRATGGKRMMELGKKPVCFWLTVEQHAALQKAAELERRPMAAFAAVATLAAVEEVLTSKGLPAVYPRRRPAR